MRYLVLCISIFVVSVIGWCTMNDDFEIDTEYVTEDFIYQWLRNDNGTLATYIKDSEQIDEDLVSGREALSETVGIWMMYAVEKMIRNYLK